jgi:hypothetical protein
MTPRQAPHHRAVRRRGRRQERETARVIAIVPTANREKATVRVRIALLSKDPRILPDMAVKVSFASGSVT